VIILILHPDPADEASFVVLPYGIDVEDQTTNFAQELAPNELKIVVLAIEAIHVQVDHLQEALRRNSIERSFQAANILLCLVPLPRVSGSSSTPLARSARPRKYLSPSGTEPGAYPGEDSGCRSPPEASTGEATAFRPALASQFVQHLAKCRPCCAAAASGNAPSARALVKMFRVRIMASKPAGDRYNPSWRLPSRGQTAICTEGQFRNSVLVVWALDEMAAV